MIKRAFIKQNLNFRYGNNRQEHILEILKFFMMKNHRQPVKIIFNQVPRVINSALAPIALAAGFSL
jgi:hypothetical protein